MKKTIAPATGLDLPAHSAVVPQPVSQIGSFTFPVRVGNDVFQAPYNANASLDVSSAQVQRAVVLVPGAKRNALYSYDTLLQVAAIAGAHDATTLLVVPQFLIEADIDFHHLPSDWLFWSEDGWKDGAQSESTTSNPRPASLSSFAVLDSILYQIGARHPNLRSLVLAGHSAGGQFVNRFAAGSTVQQALLSQFGVDVTYVVANPSSYLYFDAQRVVAGTLDQFAVPPATAVQSCPSFDDYKYGLQKRNPYMSSLSIPQIRSQFAARQVTDLLGTLDIDVNDPNFDTTCPAMLQGPDRLQRGKIYSNYLLHYFGVTVATRHRTFLVPGIGHDSRGMFTSSFGVTLLFVDGAGACTPVETAVDAARVGSTPLVLRQCQPNPFRSQTTIAYGVFETGRRSTLRVYDVLGRVVRTLHEGPGPRGSAMVVWDGMSNRGVPAPAGLYFCRLQQGTRELTRTVTLLR